MKRLVMLLSVLALLALPASVSASHGTDSARGQGLLLAFIDVQFNARATSIGLDAGGRVTFTFTSTDPDQVYRGEVTCLRVVGATVTTAATFYIVARIDSGPPGNALQSIHVFGTDSGKFSDAPDTLESFVSASPPNPDGACPTTFPFASRPAVDGEVTVHNTLP